MRPHIKEPIMSISVTHVVRQYLPSIGGMEEVVRNIALHQLRKGQKVRIVTLDRLFRNTSERLPAREQIEGIEVVRLPYYGSSRYPLCPSVLKALGDADVINVHGVDFFYDYLAATRWLHQRPLVLSTHGGFFHTAFASRAKLAYFNSITRLSAAAYSKVVATSSNDGQLFSRIVGEPKLQVIENGVNVEKFANQGATELRPVLVYFGRWSANKGLLQAIDMFNQLHQLAPEWRLIIAGREYDHSLADLQAAVTRHGLETSITLAANPSDDQIRTLIRQASYFICLSRHEGFGIAPIEAMSAGLIPVLSDIPPFRQLVTNSGLGLLLSDSLPTSDSHTDGVKSNRASGQEPHRHAAEELLKLHTSLGGKYPQMRTAAMAAANRYAWPQVADRYLHIYQQLADQRRTGLSGSYKQEG
jgi:alpha-1,3-mannosyltransferase